MHMVDKNGPIITFSDTGWGKKNINSVFMWRDLGTSGSVVAEEAV